MKYALYEATDTRDNKPMLWLVAGQYPDRKLALSTPTIEAAVIKRKTAAPPSAIVWENPEAWYRHAALGGAKLVDKWEFNC